MLRLVRGCCCPPTATLARWSVRAVHNGSESAASGTTDGFGSSFGFERVRPDEKQGRVNAVFNSVSDSYDLMNDLMSLGLHRCWKRRFVESANPRCGWRAVDVAGGTGDIAIGLVRWSSRHSRASVSSSNGGGIGGSPASAVPAVDVDSFRKRVENLVESQEQLAEAQGGIPSASCHVTVVDPSPAMMEVGRNKAAAESGAAGSIAWVEGRAEALPLEASAYHLYTIAFGMRNCTDLPAVLAEAHRVLRPYGRFACLEFCSVDNPLLSLLYDEYSFRLIPPMGQIVAGDWDSYQYLVQSIRRFPHQEAFAGMLRQAGFSGVSYEVLLPGVCAIHSGFKLP